MRRNLLTAAVTAALFVPALAGAQELPAAAGQLGLTDVETVARGQRQDAGGQVRKIHGTLPGGVRVEIEFDRGGKVEEIEALERGAFAAGAVETLIPAPVRAHPHYPGDALFRKVEFDDDDRQIDIEGRWQDGRRFEAEFAPDGRLIELKIKD